MTIPLTVLLLAAFLAPIGLERPADSGLLAVFLAPTIGAFLGCGSVALMLGLCRFRPAPLVLPTGAGFVAGVLLTLLPQLGSLHSPFLRLAFTFAVLSHLGLTWEWYLMLQPLRTMVVGMDLPTLEGLVEDASAQAQLRLAGMGNQDSSVFDLHLTPHPRLDQIVVIHSEPRAFLFVYAFRSELSRLLADYPMRPPSQSWFLVGVGLFLMTAGVALTALVS